MKHKDKTYQKLYNAQFNEDHSIIYINLNENGLKIEESKENNKRIFEFGTNVDLKFSRIKNKLLSSPHMEKCFEYGLYFTEYDLKFLY